MLCCTFYNNAYIMENKCLKYLVTKKITFDPLHFLKYLMMSFK